ncbi:MAG: PEP-utilizing enzyme [Candidatus Promineifilaceae bacterium]
MTAYDALRGQLLALAAAAVRDGRLPSPDALWLLDAADVKALDDGACFTAADIALREQALAAHREIEMPDLIKRIDDWAAGDTEPDATDGSYRGIGLTDGVVEGQAWVLREPATALPVGFDPTRTILVARSVDAGWIPTFTLVAGVVVEIGGDLSHGSIILREIGLPAVTNAPAPPAPRGGSRREIKCGWMRAAAWCVNCQARNKSFLVRLK